MDGILPCPSPCLSVTSRIRRRRICTQILVLRISPWGGGGGTRPKLGYNARHKLKIWTLRDLKTSEKGGLKYLKHVFGKFEVGGLKDLIKSRY